MPRASAGWRTIRHLAGEHDTTTSPLGVSPRSPPRERNAGMVMLAMMFIAEQRVAHQPGLALLRPCDIVEMLKETLPRKPEGKDALVARINQRHERRRGAIESRFRAQRRVAPS